MAMPAPYKPSPLSYGSPRASPFRRPESPATPSSPRQTTPSPTKPPQQQQQPPPQQHTPSRFASVTPTAQESDTKTPRGQFGSNAPPAAEFLASPAHITSSASPSRPLPTPMAASTATGQTQSLGHGNTLSQLQPAQVRILRDSFQILDRDGDGSVNREDVADMLAQLGLPATPSDLAQFFPPGGPQTLTFPTFLNMIGSKLTSMSSASELQSAFSAFDEDDSGQIDVAELREALLKTAPEAGEPALSPGEVEKIIAGFSGRRAFSKSSLGLGAAGRGRGDVFRYNEFVNSVVGGTSGSGTSSGTPGDSSAEAGGESEET
ncbi:EF-hand [Xylariaceae sp. FL0255]|nr:EF-hand [Xylariaceae sp. FL0255]